MKIFAILLFSLVFIPQAMASQAGPYTVSGIVKNFNSKKIQMHIQGRDVVVDRKNYKSKYLFKNEAIVVELSKTEMEKIFSKKVAKKSTK